MYYHKKCYIIDENGKPLLTDIKYVINYEIDCHVRLATFDTLDECEKYIQEMKEKKKKNDH
jgi:hypothetical protein